VLECASAAPALEIIMKQAQQKGFTLIELMIAVAIIGILAAIAYPNYTEGVRKSRRADAKGALLGLSNAMERRFTETNSYVGAAGTTATPADTGTPRIYPAQSPVDGGTKYYNLTINAADAVSYTLYAAPITTAASGVSTAQANDKCGTLTLSNTGVKGVVSAATGVTWTDCW
jgi:type IV pilus assembly protein PilE